MLSPWPLAWTHVCVQIAWFSSQQVVLLPNHPHASHDSWTSGYEAGEGVIKHDRSPGAVLARSNTTARGHRSPTGAELAGRL